MKKVAALFVALFGILSCSDSDTALVEKELLIEEVNDTETGQYYKFFYHPDSTLQKIELYQDGLVREWAVNYAPGTQTITEIILCGMICTLHTMNMNKTSTLFFLRNAAD